ncbi:hypothetical protein C8R32_101269 [Nitrosospira sp. Nsp5]|uniref:Transposase n=1 Tax=Nitrosospira multiformis TaxID=1231 RepID=A0ABY0TGF7_9PROT|nr:hypothetical protein C8R32_101269 [Nitrosospira sp. Nsp5]SDQ76263.1 hypothetical protein SAMN05216402_2189 [Nitrosospira multiformis]
MIFYPKIISSRPFFFTKKELLVSPDTFYCQRIKHSNINKAHHFGFSEYHYRLHQLQLFGPRYVR